MTKSDAETGTAQGNASLAGAKYGIFKGDQLIDEYYTDENGQFVTQEYICGSDWTIKELEPSEGYLLDPTVHKVGAEPELYTIEHNSLHFFNSNYFTLYSKNMWVSLGIGVILVFTLSILPQDNIVLSLFPFASPYQMLSAAVENSRTALFLAVCGIETVVFGIAEVLYLQVRRCFE